MGSKGIARVESAVRVVLKYNEAFNKHDISALLELIDDDCIYETAEPGPEGTLYVGKEAISAMLNHIFRHYQNTLVTIEDIFGFNVKCVTRWKQTWTNESGEKKYMQGVDLFKVKNKRICEKLSFIKSDIKI